MSGRRVINAAAAVVMFAGVMFAGVLSGMTAAFGDQTRSSHPDPPEAVMEKRSPFPRMSFAVPTRIRIPAINVNARLVEVNTDRWGFLRVPPFSRPNLAGWYGGGSSPGEAGAAVVVGHVDSRSAPAVFYRLKALRYGDKILVDRRDGATAVFRVERVVRVPKSRFPTEKVYGDVPYAGLRLITCGGVFDSSTRHYRDNVIAFARLVRAIKPDRSFNHQDA